MPAEKDRGVDFDTPEVFGYYDHSKIKNTFIFSKSFWLSCSCRIQSHLHLSETKVKGRKIQLK